MIIGLSGFINSGKDTVAKYLVRNHGFTKLSFASTLKDMVSVVFGWPRNLLEGDTEESRVFRETPDYFWSSKLGHSVTPRWVLQYMGTEVMRNYFCQSIWCDALENKIRSFSGDVVITDVRFLNEIAMLQDKGAELAIVLGRTPKPSWFYEVIENGTTDKAHESEWNWLVHRSKIPGRIDNQFGLSELHINIEEYLDGVYRKSKS
jgi:hypothetical protein